MSFQTIKKTIPLRGLNVSIQDVRRIVERLQPHVNDEGYREVRSMLEMGPDSPERRELLDKERKQAFQIAINILGRDGESLFGYGTDPFDSPNIPDPIQSIGIDNTVAYKAIAERVPTNMFSLIMDFSKPPLIDANNPVSSPTHNFSIFIVEGERDAWVASIHQAVMDILGKRSNRRNFIHAAFVYDIGLFVLGFPVGFYLCWRLSEVITKYFDSISSFLSVAAYIYIVFLVVSVYRVLFGYTKWAFPTVELTSNESRSKLHRKFWYAIIVGVVASAIYDVAL